MFLGDRKPQLPKVRAGTWNFTFSLVGEQGGGKTEASCDIALALQKAGALVVAHDPDWRIPTRLWDGRETGAKRHPTTAAARQAIKKQPSGIHSIATADAMDVIRFARQLSLESLREHRGRGGTPVHVIVDEVTRCSQAGSGKLGEELSQRLASRRHELLSYSFSSQSSRRIHYQILDWSTHLVLFRTKSKQAIQRLEDMGLDPDLVGRLPHLQQFEKFIVKP